MGKARSARRLLKRLAEKRADRLWPLHPLELSEAEAVELDALRARPSPLQVSYDEHPDDGQFYRPDPLR